MSRKGDAVHVGTLRPRERTDVKKTMPISLYRPHTGRLVSNETTPIDAVSGRLLVSGGCEDVSLLRGPTIIEHDLDVGCVQVPRQISTLTTETNENGCTDAVSGQNVSALCEAKIISA